MLGICRITVRHALRNLEEAGLVRREHGRGTFVRTATIVAGVRGLTSFTDEMRSLALTPGALLLEARRIPAEGEIADALEIASGEAVVKLRRLRLGDGMPIGIQTAQLPEARVPGLVEDAANVRSLYRGSRNAAASFRSRPRRSVASAASPNRKPSSFSSLPARPPSRSSASPRRPRALRMRRLRHAGGPL